MRIFTYDHTYACAHILYVCLHMCPHAFSNRIFWFFWGTAPLTQPDPKSHRGSSPHSQRINRNHRRGKWTLWTNMESRFLLSPYAHSRHRGGPHITSVPGEGELRLSIYSSPLLNSAQLEKSGSSDWAGPLYYRGSHASGSGQRALSAFALPWGPTLHHRMTWGLAPVLPGHAG